MSLAPFVPTPVDVVRVMLQLAELHSGEILFDLGCGDGRIVIIAAKEFGAKAFGVELNKKRYNKCVKTIHELDLENQVTIIHDDLSKTDLSKADVVTLYLLADTNVKIRPYLERNLKRGARVVSHDFEMPGWEYVRIRELREKEGYSEPHTLYFYGR